jgi:hypothetical protein
MISGKTASMMWEEKPLLTKQGTTMTGEFLQG